MKIKIAGLIIALFALTILGGCGAKIGEESPYGNNVNQLEGVSIEFAQELYFPENNHFELITRNQSDEEISYGIAYTLEYLNEDTWHVVNPDEEIAFILIAHILGPNSQSNEEIDMSYYEPLKIGRYRLIRQINGEILAAEFWVNNP